MGFEVKMYLGENYPDMFDHLKTDRTYSSTIALLDLCCIDSSGPFSELVSSMFNGTHPKSKLTYLTHGNEDIYVDSYIKDLRSIPATLVLKALKEQMELFEEARTYRRYT